MELTKMIKILSIFALTFILAMPATAANVTKVEIHGVVFDTNSSTYNTTLQWDAQNFTGFWYTSGSHKSSETLKIVNQEASSLTASSRVIQQENLQYNTSRTDQKYKVFSSNNSLKVENGLTSTLTKTTSGGYYARLGWFGDLYVAVNGKANKLAKLIKEQDTLEKQSLKLGATWELGEGFNLTIDALDTTTSPRQAWLSFSKDGKTLDNKVVKQGEVYTYVAKSLKGESDVPVFVTYVDSIFTGAEGMSALVQLRYTWLISQNVLEVKAGDKFGVFEVKEANENYVLLHNKDKTINLDKNTVQTLYGDLKFKVADNSTALRFYPIIEKTKPGKYEVRGGTYDQSSYKNLVWDAQRFPGFWYNLGSGKTSENLAVVQNASTLTNASRTIERENLLYNTSRTDQKYKVFSSNNSLKVENGLTSTLTKTTSGGYYARLGWFGDLYVAVNGKANKLAKLIKEQDTLEKQTLKLGTSWDLGEGYNLTVDALDTTVSPRQAHLTFSKDGNTLEEKHVTEGEVYTYVAKSLKGEPDVPIFVTYVESIFTGAEGMSALVQLRYTWLISQNVLEVKAGDKFGVFEVKEANENYVLLNNKDKPISLDKNTVQPLYGELKFKVADNSTALRFYPIFEQTIQETPKVVKAASTAATATTAPAETQTVAATPAPAPVQAAAQPAVQTAAATPVKTAPENAVQKLLGFWGFYAILGLSGAAYFVLRKKD